MKFCETKLEENDILRKVKKVEKLARAKVALQKLVCPLYFCEPLFLRSVLFR